VPIPNQSQEGTGDSAFHCQIKQLRTNTINQGSKAWMQCITLNFKSTEIIHASVENAPPATKQPEWFCPMAGAP